jgi:hypothetical protein
MRLTAVAPLAALLLSTPGINAENRPADLTADQIMRKVAWHQNRAQTMREAFRYDQSVLIRFHRGGNKLCREEYSEFVVTPTPRGSEKDLVHFLGKYRDGKELHEYYEPHFQYKDLDIDGELITELAEELTDDDDAKDGINRDLFPLTLQKQKGMKFQLEGVETYKGREVYKITFHPNKATWKEDGTPWAGEVLVDHEKLQPVLVTTRLAKGLPLVVRTVLGTNITRLGFKVAYEEFEDDLWFPVTYGGEFKVKAVFFYKRKISLSLRNSGFERSEVTSKVAFGDPVQ